MTTFRQACHKMRTLSLELQKKLPNVEDLIYVEADTFSDLIETITSLKETEQAILLNSIRGVEILVAEAICQKQTYDMQYIVRKCVNPRLKSAPEEEKKAMRKIIYSLLGMRSHIAEAKKSLPQPQRQEAPQ